jgi:transposase, IS30 family
MGFMYTHLTKEDRKAIAYYRTCNWKAPRIARILGKDRSTISRELSRNTENGEIYQYGYAHKQMLTRRKQAKASSRKLENSNGLQKSVIDLLKEKYSPEQIAGRLRREGVTLCHETVYQWVYSKGSDYSQLLRRQRSKWRKKRGSNMRTYTRKLAQFRDIDTRPQVVNRRGRIGDWEGDTVISSSKKSRILTHVERKTGYGLATLLPTVSAETVARLTVATFRKLSKDTRHTITYDRGSEFGGDDSLLEKKTKMTVYRAHPYHSWERGCNENWNGLIRAEYPKGTNFDILTQKDIDRVVSMLNHRPRKRLNYLSPHEVFVLKMVPENWCGSE